MLKSLLGLKLLASIVFDNIANEPQNWLMEEDVYPDKLTSITLGRLLATSGSV